MTTGRRHPLVAALEPAGRSSIVEAIGGRRGIIDSGLPTVVFVAVFTATRGNMTASVWAAIVAGAVSTVLRLARRETLQFAISGFIGVAIAAFIAQRTGRAENFFLPGLLINLAYAAAYSISVLVRWPLIGVVLGALTGEGTAWRRDPAKMRAFSIVSWTWAGMFLLRVAVQLPLYLAGALVALGVARLAMGWPLFLLAIWLSWLVLRPIYGGQHEPVEDTAADNSPAEEVA
jgi:Protein of unknown function (DUF3159)